MQYGWCAARIKFPKAGRSWFLAFWPFWLLHQHPGFELEDAAAILNRQGIPLDTGQFLTVNPVAHGMDGFFAAALRRVK